MRYIKVTGINRWLREMGLLLVILTVCSATFSANCSRPVELGLGDYNVYWNQRNAYADITAEVCGTEGYIIIQFAATNKLVKLGRLNCTDSATIQEYETWTPVVSAIQNRQPTGTDFDKLTPQCKNAFKLVIDDAFEKNNSTSTQKSNSNQTQSSNPSQSNSNNQSQSNNETQQQSQQSKQRAQEARQQTQQNQQRSSDAEELAASNKIIGSQKQSVQEFQQKADQARQGKRRRHEPENEASHCIQPDFGGLYGGMKNTCNFKVWYTYCGYRPSERSWLTGMNCEKQSFGSDSVMPGNTSASHTHGVQQLYWFACKEPAWPLDHEFVVGSGIRARCYTVGGN